MQLVWGFNMDPDPDVHTKKDPDPGKYYLLQGKLLHKPHLPQKMCFSYLI